MPLPLVADGYGLDRALGALFWGAKSGETVSVMAARSRVAGRWPGCVLCAFLSVAVETGHCDKALATGDTPTPQPAAYRAGALLFAFAALLVAVPYLAAWLIGRVL